MQERLDAENNDVSIKSPNGVILRTFLSDNFETRRSN